MTVDLRWVELNGTSATPTLGLANINVGSIDASNIDASAHPVSLGSNAYDKWLKVEFLPGGFSQVSNFKVWRSDNGGGDGEAFPTGVSMQGEVGTTTNLTYTSPSDQLINASEFPYTEASALNLGPTDIDGSGGETHLIHFQLQTSGLAITGDYGFALTFRYDEE